jgi:hypothetical protein
MSKSILLLLNVALGKPQLRHSLHEIAQQPLSRRRNRSAARFEIVAGKLGRGQPVSNTLDHSGLTSSSGMRGLRVIVAHDQLGKSKTFEVIATSKVF